MICRGCGADLPKGTETCTRCGADVTEVTISGITEVPKPSWYLPLTLLVLAGVVIGGGLVFFIGIKPEPKKSVDVDVPAAALPQVAAPEAGWLVGIDGMTKALEARQKNEAPVLVLFCGPKDSCAKADAVLDAIPASAKPELQRVYKVRVDPNHSKEERSLAQEYHSDATPDFVFLATERSTGTRLSATTADEFSNALNGAVGEAAKELVARGGEELAAQNQDRALKTFEAALALAPESSEAHHWRGLVYEARNDLKSAAADFKAALTSDPNNLSAMEHLGYAYLELGDTKDALSALDGLVNKAPNYGNGRAHHLRASARARAGDADGAKADMKEACEQGTQAACAFVK